MHEREEEIRVPVSEGKKVRVRLDNGAVRFVRGDEPEAIIRATHKVSNGDDIERVRLLSEEHGDTVDISVKHDVKTGILGKMIENVHSKITVELPPDVAASAKMINGAVSARGVRVAEVKNVNGPLDLTECSGEPEVKCVNGPIRITGARFGSLSAKTLNGPVEFEMASAGKGPYVVKSAAGPVSVRLADGLNLDVDAKSPSGPFSSSLSLADSRLEGKHLRGRLGSGGATLFVKSAAGPVSLAYSGSKATPQGPVVSEPVVDRRADEETSMGQETEREMIERLHKTGKISKEEADELLELLGE
jgi:hypothetical protein